MTPNATATGPKDADFFEELVAAIDQELGFEPWNEAQAQELFEAAEPVPLSAESREDTIDRVRREPPPSPPGSALRRMILPLGALVLAAAAIGYCRWGGTHSTKTLPYEQAFLVVFDETYSEANKLSALSVLFYDAAEYLTAVREASLGSGSLATEAQQALEHARLLLEEKTTANRFTTPGPKTFKELVAELGEQGRATAERSAALSAAAPLFEAGVYAMLAAKTMEPALQKDARTWLAMLKNVRGGKEPGALTREQIEGK